MSLWNVIKHELLFIFRKDPRRAVFLYGASIAYIVLFGMLYGTHVVNSVPMVVYDEDQSRTSRLLIQSFEDSERYRIVGYTSSQEELDEYMRDETALIGLIIPARFSRDVKAGLSSPVMVLANGSNLVVANAALTAAQDIVGNFAAATGIGLAETANQLPSEAKNKIAPIDLRIRVINNPTLSYLNYFLLGLAMAALQAGILLAVGASLSTDPFAGKTANQSLLTFTLAKLLPYWLCSVLGFGIAIIFTWVVFDMPVKGSPLLILALGGTFAFTVIGLASLVAALLHNEVNYTRAAVSYAVPAFIFSGYIWPIQAMQPLSQVLAYTLFPLTFVTDSLRNLMIVGYAPHLVRDLSVLLIMGIVFLGCALGINSRMLKVDNIY
jgi:ABC-2 type transport system permease protein